MGEAQWGVAWEPLASEPREDWDHVSKGGGRAGWGYGLEEQGGEQPTLRHWQASELEPGWQWGGCVTTSDQSGRAGQG